MQPNGNVPGTTGRPVAGAPVSNVNAKPAPVPTPPPVPKPAEPAFGNGGSVVEGKGGKKTGWILAVVLLLIVAAGGVGFGVWAMMDGNAQKDALNSQISALKQQNNDLQDKLDNGGNTIINMDADGNEVNTADYIYVGEWGLKIRMSEDLNYVGYNYMGSENGVYGFLYVSGVLGDSDKIPDFANMTINPMGLGVVTRYKSSANREENPSAYLGQLIFSDDEYEYYYSGSQSFKSTDTNELEMEKQSGPAVGDMLTNAENYSKI